MPINSDNFDAYTNGSTLSGQGSWSGDSGYLVDNSHPNSSPNDARDTASGNVPVMACTIRDSNSGNVFSEILVRAEALTGNAEMFVFVRGQDTPPVSYAGATFYFGGLQIGNGDSPAGLILFKRISGSNTQLGSAVNSTFSAATYYRLRATCNGTTISLSCQRVSDGMWLNSSGTFQSGQATAISVTDTSISGTGFAGFLQFQSVNQPQEFDDFLFDVVSSVVVVSRKTLTGVGL